MGTNTPPSSRRAGRRMPRPYASENDVASAVRPFLDQPETPQKIPVPIPCAASASSSRRAKKNKTAPLTCEGLVRPASIPLQSTASASRAATAFAGVFSASPAASSLSVPGFCRRTSPSIESASNPESDDLSNDAATKSTTWDGSNSPLSEESPLDRLFRADMEQRRAKLADALQSKASPSPRTQNGKPGISLRELDGALDEVDLYAVPASYQQRLLEAKLRLSVASPGPAPLPTPSDTKIRTDALKRYLFGGPSGPDHKSLVFNASTRPTAPRPSASCPSSLDRLNSWSDPQSTRSPVILAMEDSLRRALKIDSPLSAPPVG